MKSLRADLLKDQRVTEVLQSRKPFSIVIRKTGDLQSMVKRSTRMTWIPEMSGISNVCMMTMSQKEMPKLEP